MCNSILISKEFISIRVSVYTFEEDGSKIAYCPSLDLSGYGRTKKDAAADLEFVLKHWLMDQMENNSLREDLAAHGWEMKSEDRANEPSFADTVRRNAQLKRLGNKEFSKKNKQLRLPCYA